MKEKTKVALCRAAGIIGVLLAFLAFNYVCIELLNYSNSWRY